MDVMMPEMDGLTGSQNYQRNERDGCRQDPDICNECSALQMLWRQAEERE